MIRVKPSHYNVSLYDLEFGGKFTYQGTVTIDLKIDNSEQFNDIVLNAYQLKLHSAELKTGDSTRKSKDITYDEKRQRVTLDFGEKIQYSGDATLTVNFEGTINNVSPNISLELAKRSTKHFTGHGWLLPFQVQA